MRAVKEVLIDAEKGKHFKRESGIIVDDRWSKFDTDFCTQDGIIAAIPDNIEFEGNVGDRVFCHHFLTTEKAHEALVEDKMYYKIHHEDIYCKVSDDGEITMLGDWNFCTPITENETGYEYEDGGVLGKIKKSSSGIIIATNVQHDTKRCEITHLSKEAQEMGLKKGDVVIYRKDCDYEIKVDGKIYLRVRTKDFLAYEQAIQ